MNLRFVRTCYRDIVIPLSTILEIQTENNFILLFAANLIAIIVILFCLIKLREQPLIKES